MTEESYQQARKVMQKANYWRGMITVAKGNVSKWTKIEMVHRNNLQEAKANSAKKMLERAMLRLKEVREIFKELRLPESNIIIPKNKSIQCEGCRALISEGAPYCSECLGEYD